MKALFSTHFARAYQKAPTTIQRAFNRQLDLLLHDLHYPSLRAKKYDTIRWQARLTKNWRFYFRIEQDAFIFLDMIRHPK